MTATTTRLQDVDLIDPDQYQHGLPHDTWTLLWKEAPVFWHEGRDFPGFWLNRPGTYHWQAYRLACVGGDCRAEGPIVRFRVG